MDITAQEKISLHIPGDIPVPLYVTPHGAVRVSDTRVSLDTVIYYFNQGYSPEKIVDSFDTLDLANV